MHKIHIDSWENISKQNWDALLLGNGASIAIHKDFAYPRLRDIADARGLLANTAALFERLGTSDFEHVLLAYWYAEQVNETLGTPSTEISSAYLEVRKALIEAVHSVHPAHAHVSEELDLVGDFISRFPTVVSLNYDLTLYWTMLLFNAKHGYWIKDAFEHGEFQSNWESLREPRWPTKGSTLIFYPHGNLSLARNCTGQEIKIATSYGSVDLLETITGEWSSGSCVPVFVSEGSYEEKVTAIRRSAYLTNVYEKALPKLGESLVVYGWSFGDRDQHILDKILTHPLKRMAVSVYTGQSVAKQQAFCHHVRKAVGQGVAVQFFDAQSPGCWNNPPLSVD